MNFFARLHPFVLLMYFVAVLSVSMFMQHPIYLTLSFLGGVGFLVFLKGIKYVIKSLATFVLLGLIITLTNPLFSHNGATPLFFINGNAFTLEALVYGGVFALLIICVIFWFSAFNQIFDSEKILFLFGRISPKISLIFSMALNFIPNFTRYFKEILAVQKVNEKSKIKLYISCFSAVITHSLEEAIETADSMSARGYGIGKATCFSRFRRVLRANSDTSSNARNLLSSSDRWFSSYSLSSGAFGWITPACSAFRIAFMSAKFTNGSSVVLIADTLQNSIPFRLRI